MAKKPEIIGSIDINGRFTSGQAMPTPSIKTPALSAVSSNKKPVTVSTPTSRMGDTLTVKPTVTQTPKKEKKEQPSINDAIKKYGETIKNSAVKNKGLSWDNAVTDLANLYDAKRNVVRALPGGRIYDTTLSTLQNVATNMGEGALKTGEGVIDTLNDWSDAINNPLTYQANKAVYGKEVADRAKKEAEKKQEEFLRTNWVNEMNEVTGYNAMLPQLEKDSLVKRENFGGQVAQGVGGMVPSLLAGQYLGFAPELNSLEGLTGKAKLMAQAGNVGRTLIGQLPADAILGASSYGSGMEEVLNKGYSRNQARQYGLANAAIEAGTEMMTGGVPGLGGAGGIDQFIEPLIEKTGKGFLNAFIKAGYGALGEGLEESVGTYLEALARKAILGEEIEWNEVNREALQSGLLGAVTGAILNGPTNLQNFQEARQYNQMQKAQEVENKQTKLNEKINQQEETTTEKPKQDYESWYNENVDNLADRFEEKYKQQPVDETGTVNSKWDEFTRKEYEASQTETTQIEKPSAETSNNKIQNFRDSVQKEGIKDAEGFYKSVEKIIQDKDYNVIMDSSIKNADGKPVNAVISNDNGITIKINPNSERAGEILLMHEVTHGIETKEMSDLIMDYASKNSEFNSALEDLKKTYGTQDVTPEVVADISGQLFGNQEFINNLSTQKPTIFRKIYDAIVSMANKLTGNSKEALFVRDLKNKWEKAYRESTIESSQKNLKEGAKYSKNSEVEEMDLHDIGKIFSENKNVKTDRTTDNEGKKLSKGQEKFFDESKARDENGALVKVYHTVNHPIVQFNEFNPIGTPGYRFGNQVVVYATSSKDMSGSYANQEYEMADTQKLNDVDEANAWLFDVGLPFFEISGNKVFDEDGAPILEYKSKDELLRNLKSDIQEEIGYKSKLQYEGYLNIKNPFVVDGQGSDWNSVSERYDEERANLYDEVVKNKKLKQNLIDLVSESKQKQKTEYEDKKIRKQIEAVSDVLKNFKNDKLNSLFEKIGVGEDILELHPSLRDAATYEDFASYIDTANEVGDTNIKLPDANTKMSELINEDTIDYYKDSKLSPVFNGIENKTFKQFMNDLIKLYTEEGIYGTADRYFWFHMDNVFDDDVSDIIEPSEWIEAVDDNFSEEVKETLQKKALTTNDVVKLIIEENKQKTDSEKYDGIIFKKIYDYGGEAMFETPEDVYVAFNSNQFKAADNLNPTSDPDIRYSQGTNKWQKYLEKNFKSRGTTTNLKEKKTGTKATKEKVKQGPALAEAKNAKKETNQVVKESFKTKSEETVKENVKEEPTVKSKEFKKAMKSIQDGNATMKERKFVRTAVEAQNTKKLIKEMTDVQKNYRVVSNEESMTKAEAQLSEYKTAKQKADYVKGLLTSGKRITSADIAAAEITLRDVAATKNDKLYTDTLADFAALSTEYGQVIQAMSMIKKLSPTYQLDVLEKMINREKVKGNKKYKDVKVTQEMRDRVLQCYDSEGNLNQEQFDDTMEGIKQELADEIKVGVGDKVRAWRYLSMLGNPKTHVRNEVANVAMSAVKGIKDTISASAQDLFIKKENKTRTLKSSSKEVKNFANTTYNEVSEDISGNKYNELSDLEDRAKIFKTRWLEAVREFNDTALSKEDQAFKKLNFKRTFANYLTAHGIETMQDIENNPQIVQQARLFAMEEANVATFNQENKLAQFINSGDKKLGPIYRFVRGAIIPFTRTPLNIAKTGIEYTPGTGLLTTLADVKKAPKNMKGTVLIDGLSKQMVGTSLALLGYALAKGGIVTAGTDDDKEDKFLKDQGSKMDFSIKLGDTSYDLSWLSPSSMPFFVGAKMYEVLEKQEGINENIVLESLASTLDPLSEMSCISSFTKVLNSYSQEGAGKLKDIGVSTAQNYLSQFVPTILGQFARVFDPYKRTTSADVNAPNKITQETLRTLAYKVPGLRNMLPESTDYLGKTKKEDDNALVRAFNAMINPANTRKDTLTDEGKEILRLYEETGNDEIIPAALTQNVKYNDKDHQMTRKEYNKYKKDFGDAFEDNLKDLMETKDYKQASDDEKVEMIKGIMGYAKDKTKDEFLTERGEDYEKTLKDGSKSPYESDKVDALTNNDFSIADYYVYKAYAPNVIRGKYTDVRNRLNVINTFGIDKEVYQQYMDEIGQISGSNRKQKIFEYINSLPLTSEQKKLLMKKQYKSYRNYDKQLFNTINESDLTLEEKESLKNFLKIGE